MKAPDKIYLYHEQPKDYFDDDWHELPANDVENICYIRKDIVDETVKTAEDHAYFAGQEKFREKMLEWLQKEYDTNKWFYDTHAKPNNLHTGRCEAYKQAINKLNSM